MPKVELDLAQMQQINGINSDRIMTLLGNIYKLEKTYQAMTDKLQINNEIKKNIQVR